MSFNQEFLMTSTLVRVELPNKTLRICDGGVIIWPEEPDGSGGTTLQQYNSEDPDFGTLMSGEGVSEGDGDEAPAAAITFLANSNAALEDLTSPNMQWSPVTIWQAAINKETGLVIAAIPLLYAFIDVPTLKAGAGGLSVEMTLVSDTERFFIANEGNRLSQENHQRRHPGELGLNNMTGVEIDVAWGTESRPVGSATTSGGGGSGGGSSSFRNVQLF